MKMLKWQQQYIDNIVKMTNEEVLDEYSNLCGGDDYDGCYTKQGEWQHKKITEELHKRLRDCNFIQ